MANGTAPYPIQLFNSLTRTKEKFTPHDPKNVRIYTCGPTVYHYVHIGNLRTFLFEDILRRALKYFGYGVTQVMNLTDVDDKTIRGAIREKVTLDEFTKPYVAAFFDDLKTLSVEPAEHYPAATDYISQMIQMIEGLIAKGVAYKGSDGSVYFSIEKFPHYGCLSHLKLHELKAGGSERVIHDEYDKENLSDFVLWKAYDPERDGQIFWESPFGKGRPGWHLECSVMAMQILGETIDIHVGGIDNMFPHHENEIAQSEAYSGKKFVDLWMHAEHLIVDGKKMSKSLGNFYTLRDLLKQGFDGTSIRYLLIQTHYKTQLNFTLAGIQAAKGSLQRLQDFIFRLNGVTESKEYGQYQPYAAKVVTEFAAGLADDLNISHSLAALFDFVRDINTLIDQGKIGKAEGEECLKLLKKFNQVIAVLHFDFDAPIPEAVQALFNQRQQARVDKNWALSDTLRNEILLQGFVIEDSAGGARLKKK